MNIEIYSDYIAKSIFYSLTEKAKTLKSKYYGLDNEAYEIAPYLPITIPHLLSVLLYTNHTDLQYNFKKYGTRFHDKASTFPELKKWNAKIGWWYIYLCQAVLFYGSECNSKTDIFYHGLSVKLLFPNFNPTFRAPISTTTAIQVAQRFATHKGILIVLKPTPNSEDRYFDTTWLSNFPQEQERLFFVASQLDVQDILYIGDGLTLNNSNANYILPMKLFGEIFFQKCHYSPYLLKTETQKSLIELIKQITRLIMDNVYEWNDGKTFNLLNEFLQNEEYDTDCLEMDIFNEQESNIFTLIGDDWTDFEDFCRVNLNSRLPQYLHDLFRFIAEPITKHERITIIRSEYENKLIPELQSTLNALYDQKKVIYTHEFIWEISGDDFEELMCLNTGKQLEGPEFQCDLVLIEDDNRSRRKTHITILPVFVLKDSSFPQSCSFGIELMDIGNEEKVTLYWTFSVKEINYVRGRSEYLYDVEQGHYDGVKAFKNELLNDVDKLTIAISVY